MLLFWRKYYYSSFVLLLCSAALSRPCYSEIVFDGSLKPSLLDLTLSGDMVLTEEQGVTSGSNIFYSFKKFNIMERESLLFTGSSSFKNIFSRVTGDDSSIINGGIRYDYNSGNPALFLINPNGVVFGEKANIDIQGSLFVGTANSINFDDGKIFHASLDSKSMELTAANPDSFGFLNKSVLTEIKGIEIKGSRFSVPPGKTIFLAGGGINVVRGSFLGKEGMIGEIYFISRVNKEGEAIFRLDEKKASEFIDTGGISFYEETEISAGSIFIRGGEFVFEGVQSEDIVGDNFGTLLEVNKKLSIKVNKDVLLGYGSQIVMSGELGEIFIKANRVDLSNLSSILTNSVEGNIEIITKELDISSGSTINVDSVSGEKAGSIQINSEEYITISGVSEGEPSRISATTLGGGESGIIYLVSNTIRVEDRGEIRATANGSHGLGGTIVLDTNNIKIVGGSRVSTQAFDGAEGGDIFINANRFLQLVDQSEISSSVDGGDGNGGNIFLNFSKEIDAIKIKSSGKSLVLLDSNSAITTSVRGDKGQGDGGNIVISDEVARNGIAILGKSQIRADTNADLGKGGSITIRGQSLIPRDILDQRITASSPDRENTGEISILEPEFDATIGTLELPESFFDASNLIANRCAIQGQSHSSFIVTQRDGLSASPDLLLAGYEDFDEFNSTNPSTESLVVAHDAGNALARINCSR